MAAILTALATALLLWALTGARPSACIGCLKTYCWYWCPTPPVVYVRDAESPTAPSPTGTHIYGPVPHSWDGDD